MQFFSFRYKKLFFNHLYYAMNQYVDILNSLQRHTSSDSPPIQSPPIQVRLKSDNPWAYWVGGGP